MKELDWADEGWNRFATVYLAEKPSASTLRLLKEAWLHGARAALDQAQAVVGEQYKAAGSR